MTPLTVAELKASFIPETLNIAPDDPRFLQILNMALERLMNRGDWIGAFAKIRLCTAQSCFAWPRQVERVEKIALCNDVLRTRTQWYEFLDFGVGLNLVNAGCPVELIDDGYAPTVNEIQGTAKLLKVYAFVAEDSDAVVTAEGYDENLQWIRTQVDGVWQNGENIPISLTPQTSTKLFGAAPTALRKPRTNGTIRVYSLNTADNTELLLAEMQYDETVSNYRRSRITNWNRVLKSCCSCDGRVTLTAIVKLAFVPVAQDEDWLPISNRTALLDAMQGVQKLAKNLFGEGHAYLNSAVNELNKQMRTSVGRDKVSIGFYPHGSAHPWKAGIGQMI